MAVINNAIKALILSLSTINSKSATAETMKTNIIVFYSPFVQTKVIEKKLIHKFSQRLFNRRIKPVDKTMLHGICRR